MAIEFVPERAIKSAAAELKSTKVVSNHGEPVDLTTAALFVIAALCIAGGVVASMPVSPLEPIDAFASAADADNGAPLPIYAVLPSLAPQEIGALNWDDEPATLFSRTVRYRRTIVRLNRPVAQVHVPGPDGLWQQADVQIGDPIPDTNLTIVRIDPKIAFARDADGHLHRLFYPPQWRELAAEYRFRSNPIPITMLRLSESPLWTLQTGSRRIYGANLMGATSQGLIPDDVFKKLVPELEKFAIELQMRASNDPSLDSVEELQNYFRRHRISNVFAVPDPPSDLDESTTLDQ